MRVRAALLIVMVFAGTAVPAVPSPGAKIPRTAEFQRRIDDSIARGIGWLRDAQHKDGGFGEYPGYPAATTALVYHTLRVCGVAANDPAAMRAWDSMRRDYVPDGLQTYAATCLLMAIESHGERIKEPTDGREVTLSPEDKLWAGDITRRLAAGQLENGAFSYRTRVPRGEGSAAGAGAERVWSDTWDQSNSQYALLGLKCASRCGVAIDRSVWTLALGHWMREQAKDGPEVERRPEETRPSGRKGATSAAVRDRARGWTYEHERVGGSEKGTVAMTAAGVSSIVICRSELLGTSAMRFALAAESERSVWDGLAWLGTRWNPPTPPPGTLAKPGQFADEKTVLYDLYGIERAGVLAGVEWMVGIDWHGRGAPPVLDTQQKDGGWGGVWGRLSLGSDSPGVQDLKRANPVDTCFALLFLKKGTAPVPRGAVTQVGGDDDIRFSEAVRLTGRDFEDFIDLVLSRWRRAADTDVKRRIFDGATSAGPRIVESLIVRLSSEDADDRSSAHALLAHATGRDFGFLAGAPAEEREAALAKWTSWWMTAKDRLVYDAEARKLVEK